MQHWIAVRPSLPLSRLTVPVLIVCACASMCAQESGRPLIAPIFADHMVIQRDRADPVWGWAEPGESITVTIADRSARAVAGSDGRWITKIVPPPAGGPYELSVSGSRKVTVKDVLVGDVWVCSGQSNMEYGLGKDADAEREITRADHPQIRLFTVAKVAATRPREVVGVKAGWEACTPASIIAQGHWGGFSAVGYFFARDLHQNLGVPVGLVQAAWGSTYAEVWTSSEGLASISPEFDKQLEGLATVNRADQAGPQVLARTIDDWYLKNGADAAVSTVGYDAFAWKVMRGLPHDWSVGDDPALRHFRGAVLFRREIDLPAQAAGKAGELHLGRIEQEDVTWINGIKVGGDRNPWSRTYKVPAGVLQAGRNVIATWVLSDGDQSGITGDPRELALIVQGGEPLSLAGDWRYEVLAAVDRMSARLATVANNAGWPTEVFNGMVAPLAPFGIRGVIWYQGEANVGRARQYRRLLPALIASWRARWQQGDFPFLIVQLPNFGPPPGKKPRECPQAELREAQGATAATTPGVGVVGTIDIGDPGDLHPRNKLVVGQRLALLARAMVYGQDVPCSGPLYRSSRVVAGAFRIRWTHAEGLRARDGRPLACFALAGDDHVFHWADARIEGDEVVLTSDAVPSPVAARYDWDWSPDGNLTNQADLPAFPFRTDDWSVVPALNP